MIINKWLSIVFLVIWSTHIFAESYGTAFTYQGQLQYQGSAAQGEFDFMFTLFDSELDGTGVATPVELENVEVADGRFTVELDFGTVIQAADQYWLEIGVRPGESVDAHSLLAPRQYLYPSPRSIFALRSANSDALQGHPASDFALSLHDHAGQYWLLGGNAGTVPGHFLGTVDNQALELRVNGARALRLEPGVSSPNVLGGYALNAVTGGAQGATVSGGGRDLANNQAAADYAAIGGGAGNTVGGYAATVGGGESQNATGSYATIGGGTGNTTPGNSAVISGGQNNVASGSWANVSGGSTNDAAAAFTSVGGGANNQSTGNFAVVAGGSYNDAQAKYAAILGGGPSDEGNPTTTNNRVSDDYGAIGGGGGNTAGDGAGTADDATFATVGGGRQNSAAGGYAAVGGGDSNTASGYAAAIAGGGNNSAASNYATVSGGVGNSAGNQYATVSGGRENTAGNVYATVGGGYANTATGAFSIVPGGVQNVASGNYSLAAGQGASAVHTGSFVWSDSDTGPFSSTADDQFLIKATGGVGIGTDSPSAALHVVGDTDFKGNARVLGEDDLVLLGNVNSTVPGCATGALPGEVACLQDVSAISAVGNTAFLVAYSSNTLAAFDVTDPQNIQVKGNTTSSLQGPQALVATGRHVYVASRNNSQLVVFETPPEPLGSWDTKGAVVLPGKPEDVFVSGNYAYLVGSLPTVFLAVVDISDPSDPTVRSFVPTGGKSIHVSDSRAYVAAPAGLDVYDVSDPDAIALIGSTSDMASSPSAIHVSGNRAYVTMESSNTLVVYDISNPAAPSALGSAPTGSLVRPVSVTVSGDHAFVASEGDPASAENNGIVVLDVSDPASIVVRGTATEDGQRVTAIAVAGARVFATSRCTTDECCAVNPDNQQCTGIDDRLALYEFNHLETPALQAGNLQAGYLDVVDSASVANGLSVGGGLNVGQAHVGGDLGVGGDLKAMGQAQIGGNLDLGRDLRLLYPVSKFAYIGAENSFVCEDWDGDDCVLWSPPIINFTSDIRPGENRILGAPIDHCLEGRYLYMEECCGIWNSSGNPECLPDIVPIELEAAIVIGGGLVPSCDATDELCGPLNLGHPSLRWNEVWALNGLIQTSDGRLKGNVTPLSYGLADLEKLEPVSFAWKDGDPDVRHLGLVAQQVREVIPELVHGGDDGSGALGLNYGELVPVLINAVKDLQGELADQASMIEALQKRLDLLERLE